MIVMEEVVAYYIIQPDDETSDEARHCNKATCEFLHDDAEEHERDSPNEVGHSEELNQAEGNNERYDHCDEALTVVLESTPNSFKQDYRRSGESYKDSEV